MNAGGERLAAFVSELERTGAAHTTFAHVGSILVHPDARRTVAECAARHGLEVSVTRRYASTLRDGDAHVQLISPERPRAHVALGLAHVLTDWDRRLQAGDQNGMPDWADLDGAAVAPPAGVAEMAERLAGDLYAHTGDVTQRLSWSVEDWLVMGEYGTDPAPADTGEHTLAALISDKLAKESYHSNNGELQIAAEEGLRSAHLVRSAPLLAAEHPVRILARTAGQNPEVTR
jgi:hypothetical protein